MVCSNRQSYVCQASSCYVVMERCTVANSQLSSSVFAVTPVTNLHCFSAGEPMHPAVKQPTLCRKRKDTSAVQEKKQHNDCARMHMNLQACQVLHGSVAHTTTFQAAA